MPFSENIPISRQLKDASGLIINPATEDKQLADNHQVTVSNPTTNPETGLAKEAKQDTMIAKDFATSAKQDTAKIVLDNIKIKTDNLTADPATATKQLANGHNVNIEGLGAPVTTALTLTTVDTAYKMPASELASRKLLIIYNVSDTDVYIGSSSVTTTNGILLEAGGVMNIDCESDLYAICGVAGKIVNLLELS